MKEYLTFKIGDRTIAGKSVYHVFSKKDKSQLGIIFWYFNWHQYIFDPKKDTIWSDGCLLQIINFIKQLNVEAKA